MNVMAAKFALVPAVHPHRGQRFLLLRAAVAAAPGGGAGARRGRRAAGWLPAHALASGDAAALQRRAAGAEPAPARGGARRLQHVALLYRVGLVARGGAELPAAVAQVLIEKCLGRRLCSCCGKSFNVADINLPASASGEPAITMPPLNPPASCVPYLEMRSDDNYATIKRRLEVRGAVALGQLPVSRASGVCASFWIYEAG